MAQVTQEEVAATLAGELDMHIEDLNNDGGVLAVEGHEPVAGCPTIDAALGLEGNTFVVTTNTGQRFMVTVTDLGTLPVAPEPVDRVAKLIEENRHVPEWVRDERLPGERPW